ncbi:HIT domain-containing protein [Solilutibacter silvestris]|uniref:Diadenosine tetraphosphate (Ap4A) hydrolase n=1 Tax=Solilutibacter silvestris TaxID=1645665 RepID=A0A2K1PYY5_9GAMM|nr:HIT family protein [Lysobacter silvestris]PNS07998.1 Diadenosine tetraphosphate (Ap4A) hydrolase [Lysobacter silvestris]
MSEFILHPQLAADTHLVAPLQLCDVLLMNDANYPWLILVPRVANASELLDLDDADRTRLRHEIDSTSQALRDIFQPDKLNIAALGNMVNQLHVHVIARFRDDAAWPKPVWGAQPSRPYAPQELDERISALRDALPLRM